MKKRRNLASEVVFERTVSGQLFYDLFFSRLPAAEVFRRWRPQLTLAQIRKWRKDPLRKQALKLHRQGYEAALRKPK